MAREALLHLRTGDAAALAAAGYKSEPCGAWLRIAIAEPSLQLARDLSCRPCGADGIGRPHVAHDSDLVGATDGQDSFHPRLQQRIEPGVGIAHARLLRQRDGSLGEALKNEIGKRPSLSKFNCGVDPVARVACTGSDSDGLHIQLALIRE